MSRFGLLSLTLLLIAFIVVSSQTLFASGYQYSPHSDGLFEVGKDIAPGLWRSNGTQFGCFWERLDSHFNQHNAHYGYAGGTVNIAETDHYVRFIDCATWTYVEGEAQRLQADARDERDDGLYTVGIEIVAGTWVSDEENPGCYSARLDRYQNIIANREGPKAGYITIAPSDYEVELIGCGTWSLQGGGVTVVPTPYPTAIPPTDGCVIPPSGPWPPCATQQETPTPYPTATAVPDGSCVIPESGPWPPCATDPQATPEPPTDPAVSAELVAYYAFGETSGTQALDGANNNTATLNAAVSRIDGPGSKAIRINNGGQFSAPSSAENSFTTNDFSISYWLRSNQASGVQRVLDKRTTTPTVVGYHMFVWDGKIGIQLADGNGVSERCHDETQTTQCTNYISNQFVADGNWHFITVTVDRDQTNGLRIYVDNRLVSSMNPTDRQGSLTTGAAVPLVMDSSGSALDIDEFRLYDGLLSTSDIATLFGSR